MKTFKEKALYAAIFFLFLTGNLFCQAAPASIALAFPVRIEMSKLTLLIAENTNEWDIWASVRQGLASDQTLANGSPLPEALSFVRILRESFQTKVKTSSIAVLELDATRALAAQSDSKIFDAAELKGAQYLICTVYSIEGNSFRFGIALLEKSAPGFAYFSDPIDVFGISGAAQAAIEGMVLHGFFSAKTEPAASMANASSALPKIEPWLLKSRYEKANNSLKFAIGGISVSLSAAFLSAGLWQTYREAAYRNSAFESAVTISGMATGASIAATAVFLSVAIWNAVTILQTTR